MAVSLCPNHSCPTHVTSYTDHPYRGASSRTKANGRLCPTHATSEMEGFPSPDTGSRWPQMRPLSVHRPPPGPPPPIPAGLSNRSPGAPLGVRSRMHDHPLPRLSSGRAQELPHTLLYHKHALKENGGGGMSYLPCHAGMPISIHHIIIET